jgi:hypothetical protein
MKLSQDQMLKALAGIAVKASEKHDPDTDVDQAYILNLVNTVINEHKE